jgi:3-phenylpropionate/trans-cinnamate dioxygenase ferredoxin reductase subunit
MLIRPATFWVERNIALLPERRVAAIDPIARTVVLDSDERLGFGDLVWAAGGRPHRLSCAGADLAGVHSVRCRADVERMIAELPDTRAVVAVGGGYIGLEAAAVLTKLGKQVTVLEAQGRVLARVAGEPLSRFFEAEHRAHGVDVRLGATVADIDGRAGRASGVRLADGELLPCDMVVAGIGIAPNVEPLRTAGADCTDGVHVDAFCRTSLPGIYAIGDCSAHENRFAGDARVRLESVQNANDQANTAARALSGAPQPYDAVPWFWSNQYDLKLQTVGLSIGYDRTVLRGDPAERSFSLVYLREGRVIALDCVNATRDYAQGKRLVEAGTAPAPEALADKARALKELV